MKCQKCLKDFEEKDIHESHDVPCYLFEGKNRKQKKPKADVYGRHNLCIDCHQKYELFIYGFVVSRIDSETKRELVPFIKYISEKYFKGEFRKEKENSQKILKTFEKEEIDLKKIINYCLERGFLLDKEMIEILKNNKKWCKIIDEIFIKTKTRFITKKVYEEIYGNS